MEETKPLLEMTLKRGSREKHYRHQLPSQAPEIKTLAGAPPSVIPRPQLIVEVQASPAVRRRGKGV